MNEKQGLTGVESLQSHLATVPPGGVADTADLERLLAAAWDGFAGDDGGMRGYKLLGRMEDVEWDPPLLTFTLERHGGTALGSTRATLQEWVVDMEKRTVACFETRQRQVRPAQPRLDVTPLAEEIVALIVNHREDHRLKRYATGRVRVLISKVLPESSAVKQTLAGRRTRFRAAVGKRLAAHGWHECNSNVYGR
jgi:hypothetical protein